MQSRGQIDPSDPIRASFAGSRCTKMVKSDGLPAVVEVSLLLTYIHGASDVSSHSSDAFPSEGSNLHTWPDLWFGLFLAREKRVN